MRLRSELRWRKPRTSLLLLHAALLSTAIFHDAGAQNPTGSSFEDDAIIIEASSNNKDISSGPKTARSKRQLGFPSFGGGLFPPGWPFQPGSNQQISVAQQFPQFPQFPGINNNLQQFQPLQPTHPPATTPPPSATGPCLTNNGLSGYCASFRQCYPILYSPDDGHIMNNGLAEMYMNMSGSCNRPGISHFFMFRADAQLRQNQICCGSSVASQPSFPSFGGIHSHIFHQLTMRPPGFVRPQRVTTTTTSTTTTTTTTPRPTQTPPQWPHWTQQTTSQAPQWPHWTQPTTTQRSTQSPQWPHWTQPSTTQRTTQAPQWPHWTQQTTTQRSTQAPQWPHWTQQTTTTRATARPPAPPSTTETPPVSSSCGVGKIVGGSSGGKGEFPWLVALVRNGRQVCGGTLIDSQYILTAAHCFNGVTGHELQQLFKVYIGDYDLHTISDGPMTVKSVSKLILHRQFHQQYFYNDIALLKLDSPVQFGSNGNNDIRPICISSGGNYEGQPATVAGWGRLSAQSAYQPGIYRKVDLQIWNLQQCAATYGSQAPGGITSQMMCAGVTNKDSCLGDSGGPLMRKVGNIWEQIGIVSWGIGCGQYPGVYTKVADYADWIARHRHS